MEESEYHKKADLALQGLQEFCEELENSHDVEVELEEGVLTFKMPDRKVYVINKHTPSRQIWVSSPYSGAGYFEENDGNWVPKRSEAAAGRNLSEFIKAEIRKHLD